jgi:hypothetical protein
MAGRRTCCPPPLWNSRLGFIFLTIFVVFSSVLAVDAILVRTSAFNEFPDGSMHQTCAAPIMREEVMNIVARTSTFRLRLEGFFLQDGMQFASLLFGGTIIFVSIFAVFLVFFLVSLEQRPVIVPEAIKKGEQPEDGDIKDEEIPEFEDVPFYKSWYFWTVASAHFVASLATCLLLRFGDCYTKRSESGHKIILPSIIIPTDLGNNSVIPSIKLTSQDRLNKV